VVAIAPSLKSHNQQKIVIPQASFAGGICFSRAASSRSTPSNRAAVAFGFLCALCALCVSAVKASSRRSLWTL